MGDTATGTPRPRKPEEVSFLAFEGGGGKGVTYLGAIRALEQLLVLPVDANSPGQNQIRGISGASAGAITALLLAMGLTSPRIAKLLSHPATFTAFFDGPDQGLVRTVDRNNRPGVGRNPVGPDETSFGSGEKALRLTGLGLFGSVVSAALRDLPGPIGARLIKSPGPYLYNLLFDRGLFPGFAPRQFLAGIIDRSFGDPLLRSQRSGGPRPSPGAVMGFAEFHALTGVDLVITGANVTQRRPALFSSRFTPDFPVAEAVGISMNLPVLFKPVRVDANVPVGEHHSSASAYHGEWVDGGLLNNLPLHAFDHVGQPVETPSFSLPLNPRVLGIRLTENPDRSVPRGSEGFATLKHHLGDVVETMMFPAEQGQIRSPQEAAQTIDLWTYKLSTTEFAPPPSASEKPIKEAERKVYEHFGGARFRTSVSGP